MIRQDESALRSLIEKVVEESRLNSMYKPLMGPASQVLIARYINDGFELACSAESAEEFFRAYNSQIVGDFRVPYEICVKALEGAKAAVQLGLSRLTAREIDSVAIIKVPIFQHLKELLKPMNVPRFNEDFILPSKKLTRGKYSTRLMDYDIY